MRDLDGTIARKTDPIATLIAADGTRTHGGVTLWRSASLRDLADAVHTLCAVHGGHPGVIDHARDRGPAAIDAWLAHAAWSFGRERAYLATLTAAVGPVPSTSGQAQADAALATQRHALDMLAQSDRAGCAFGAAAALVLDWPAIRLLLDRAAEKSGAPVPVSSLPRPSETAAAIATVTHTPALARAAAFGAQQLLAQHRGLWRLLEARIAARIAD